MNNRLGYLDGLRGWAALVVFAYHLYDRFLRGGYGIEISSAAWILTDGPLAVMVFFVISGFAISASNLDPDRRNLQIAAASRYFRLAMPILATSVLSYFTIKLGWMHNLRVAAHGVSTDWIGHFFNFNPTLYGLFKFSGYDVFFAYAGTGENYNSSLWTIQYELFGSFLIYGYLALFKDALKEVRWMIILPIFLIAMIAAPYVGCFLGGYLLAEVQRIKLHYKIGSEMEAPVLLIAICCVGIATLAATQEPRIMAWIAFGLVFAVSTSSSLSWLFQTRLSRWLGIISFPLYLVHVTVICSWSSWLFLTLKTWPVEQALLINLLSTTAIVLIISAALVPMERKSIKVAKLIGARLLALKTVCSV